MGFIKRALAPVLGVLRIDAAWDHTPDRSYGLS